MKRQPTGGNSASGRPKDSYRDAGVDIDAGNRLIERIKPAVAQTARQGVLSGLGGFGALFELPTDRYQHPVMVSSTDGVGTKLKLASELNRHHGIGIDLVAMCVNDVIVQGAEPLFFLDYYATGKLDDDLAACVIEGIAQGCQSAGMALIGGETAEMPDMYQGNDYDLAGFCVGIVEKERLIDGSAVCAGDAVIGIASSGPHANGFSLIRKIIRDTGASLSQHIDGRTLGECLMEPTRIYVQTIMKVLDTLPVHAMAHITGGGLLENLPRVLPRQHSVYLDSSAWPCPPIFQWIQEQGNLGDIEMYRTFNCGLGMVLCVPADDCQTALTVLENAGEKAWLVGSVAPTPAHNERVIFQPTS